MRMVVSVAMVIMDSGGASIGPGVNKVKSSC